MLKLKQMGARNQSRALQETISFYAKNLSLRGLMHFLLAAIMPRLITPEPGERERVTPTLGYLIPDSSLLFSFQHLAARWLSSRLIAPLFASSYTASYFSPSIFSLRSPDCGEAVRVQRRVPRVLSELVVRRV